MQREIGIFLVNWHKKKFFLNMVFKVYNKNLKSIFGGRIYFLSSKNNVLDRLKIRSENGIGHAMLPQFLEIWLQSFKRTKNRL